MSFFGASKLSYASRPILCYQFQIYLLFLFCFTVVTVVYYVILSRPCRQTWSVTPSLVIHTHAEDLFFAETDDVDEEDLLTTGASIKLKGWR